MNRNGLKANWVLIMGQTWWVERERDRRQVENGIKERIEVVTKLRESRLELNGVCSFSFEPFWRFFGGNTRVWLKNWTEMTGISGKPLWTGIFICRTVAVFGLWKPRLFIRSTFKGSIISQLLSRTEHQDKQTVVLRDKKSRMHQCEVRHLQIWK